MQLQVLLELQENPISHSLTVFHSRRFEGFHEATGGLVAVKC